MPRLIGSALAAALAFAGGAATAEIHVSADPSCRVIRILPNGRRIVTPPRTAYRADGPAYAAAASTGESSSSSVSVSSSSRGRGRARASSTSSGRGGETVTTTHDDNGCTVTIDRRRGARR